jgi:hypothetical protein
LPEILALTFIHERLFVGRPIGLALFRTHLSGSQALPLFLFANLPRRPPYIGPPFRLQVVKLQLYDSDHEYTTKNVIPPKLRRKFFPPFRANLIEFSAIWRVKREVSGISWRVRAWVSRPVSKRPPASS